MCFDENIFLLTINFFLKVCYGLIILLYYIIDVFPIKVIIGYDIRCYHPSMLPQHLYWKFFEIKFVRIFIGHMDIAQLWICEEKRVDE